MHVDNSACNLASLNLLAFHRPEETGEMFETEEFVAAAELVFAAQEIIVGPADYPTDKIAENTRKFRQLGLGYANLGALLMAVGAPYDSDRGRAIAATVTALMGGSAYNMSARMAARVGPFDGYEDDAKNVQRVLGMHSSAVGEIDASLVPDGLLQAAQAAWDDTCVRAAEHGVRNAQATVLAPTGTISFLMDCDTTGIEPDLGLVKMKKLVGGGTMQIVNQGVGRALTQLGYDADAVEGLPKAMMAPRQLPPPTQSWPPLLSRAAKSSHAHAPRVPSNFGSPIVRASLPLVSTTMDGRASCSFVSPSKARRSPESWTPLRFRSATVSNMACRSGPSSMPLLACALNRRG